MDNQLFPGGNGFIDDVVTQVCPLCGMMFNNALTYQHHMQLHFLTAATNAQMRTQPPPDPGIGMTTPAGILDLMGGSQHGLSSAAVSLIPPQAVFTGTPISTLPPHLISPGTGLTTSALPTMGIPRQAPGRVKEKKTKSLSSKASAISTASSINTPSVTLLPVSTSSATFKSSDSSNNSYMSSFPKDVQKMDALQSNPPNAQQMSTKPSPVDLFQTSASQLDPLEALLYTSPVKQPQSGVGVLDRQLSHSNTSPQDAFNVSKDVSGVKKLFQPFVSNNTPVSAAFVSKSNMTFNTNSLMSPMKTSGNKHDVLTTPQKSSYPSGTDNMFTSPTTMPSAHGSDLHHFGILPDNDTDPVGLDRKLDLPSKVAHHIDDPIALKSQYFPGIVDSSSISPKTGQTARKKDIPPIDPLLKMNALAGSLEHSRSSSPVSRAALIGDFGAARPDSPKSMISPKISPALPGGVLDTESASLPAKSHMFTSDVLPSASVPSAVPPVFPNTVGTANTAGVPSASPALDIAVNPLGTVYLNALTQKLLNPSFNAMGPDFNKPSSSSTSVTIDDLKGSKSYFENGVLISNDYDKISDTNDEDDLERWIDDIDDKTDNNMACEIEDLLNEFNEKQTDEMKNKSQVDDFIKDVIGEPSTSSKPVAKDIEAVSVSKADETFNPPDEFKRNESLISEILEEEKEKIDKESKELENARLSASGMFNTTTATSTSVTVSSATSTGTVTSVSNSDPKMSSSSSTSASASAETPEKKDDDHVDFEIPKVGKLMKIRKYFENREQKRKEQTEKVAEIKIHEKTEPVVEDKPLSTILVQVSKRKKIEYGPYLNRQSLLEGKPKTVENTTPPKTYRPKPKPQPNSEKRTFNLRERKTKTDFATLASGGTRTGDGKRTEQRPQRSNEKGEKVEKERGVEEPIDTPVEEKVETPTADELAVDNKIVTRHQEKKKEPLIAEEKGTSKPKRGTTKSNQTNIESDTEKAKEVEAGSNDNENRKLRSRNARSEKTDNVEGKNLRKRTIRSDADTNIKSKIKKTEEEEQTPVADNNDEKASRSTRSKIKTTGGTPPDKAGIKKCSVNLGEKYTDPKIKCAKQLDKKGIRINEGKDNSVKLSEENKNGNKDDKAPCIEEKTITSNESVKQPEITNASDLVNMETSDNDKSDSNSEKTKVDTEITDDKSSSEDDIKKQGNIFDKMDQTDFTSEIEENMVPPKKSRSELVTCSITSTDNTDKKVTMKLKLGPNFQKAFENAFNPKKRKHEYVEEPAVKVNAIPAKELDNDKITPCESAVEEKTNEETELPENEDRSNEGERLEKKAKHSVENEFQRVVEEAMKKAQNEGDSGKQERYVNLRRRLNDNVKYNVDDSDEEIQIERIKMLQDDIASVKTTPKGSKGQGQTKSTPKSKSKQDNAAAEAAKLQQQQSAKKDMDVYDFTDTEMSDSEESASKKLGFKPKYVSNLNLFGQKKLPFVSKPLSPSKSPVAENVQETVTEADPPAKLETDQETSYVGKTVEPLKIKLSKIKPFKEKKHKHKKKKKKRDKERREEGPEKLDSCEESRESMDCEKIQVNVEFTKLTEVTKSSDLTKTDEIKTVESASQENNNLGVEDDNIDCGENVAMKASGSNSDSNKKNISNEGIEEEMVEVSNIVKGSGSGSNASNSNKKTKNKGKRTSSVDSASASQENNSNNSNTGNEEESNDNGGNVTPKGSNSNSNKKSKLKEKKHICEYCNVGFGQKCDLRRHVMIHTGERPWPCEICDKRFQRKTDLVKHTRTHTGEKPYACEFCDKRVSDKSQLNVHRRLHTGARPYCCEKCGKRCITSSELSRHKAVHCEEKVERCNLCRKAFTIKECLGMHMKLHYRSKGKAFKCVKCAIGFDKKSDLDNHHCIDPMKNLYMCSECYEEFNDEMLYAEHIKTHDLGVLACNVCTNMFEDKHSLETHLCSLGMEKQRQFCCEICDLEFQDADGLNSHLILHDEDVGSFMCDMCPEKFTVRKYFVEHLKVHDTGGETKSAVSKEDNKLAKMSVNSGDKATAVRKEVNSAEIENRLLGPLKQEVMSDDEQFDVLSGKHDSGMNLGENLPVTVKSEMPIVDFASSSRPRASVISGMFRIDDETEMVKQKTSTSSALPYSDTPSVSAKSNTDNFNVRSTDFLDSDKLFETSDFTNSPDFSTLTDVDDMNPFEGLSASLSKDTNNKSAKSRLKSSEKSGKSVNYFDSSQKLRSYSNTSQSFGFIPSSNSPDTSLENSQSIRVLQKQNSLSNSMLPSDNNSTHSSNNSFSDRNLHRSISQGQDIHRQETQIKSSQSFSQNKQWSSFSLSASDFVNSVLSNDNKRDLDRYESGSRTSSGRHGQLDMSVSKNDSVGVSLPNRGDIYNKDNIENQMKSNMFSNFELNSQKSSSMQGHKLSASADDNSSDAGSFQGFTQSGYNAGRFHSSGHPEKSEYSVFQPYLSQYSASTSYSSNINNTTLTNSVSAEVNKRHLQGMFSSRPDALHSNFYLSDSMKDVAGPDKGSEEPATLLSNFDQF